MTNRKSMSIFSTELDIQLEYRKVCIEEEIEYNHGLEEYMKDIIRTRGYKSKLERLDKTIDDAHHERDLTMQKQIVYEREKSIAAASEVEKILLQINANGRTRYKDAKTMFNEMNTLAKKHNKEFLEILGYYDQKAPLLVFDTDDLETITGYLGEVRDRYHEMMAPKEDFVQARMKQTEIAEGNNGR